MPLQLAQETGTHTESAGLVSDALGSNCSEIMDPFLCLRCSRSLWLLLLPTSTDKK